MSAASKNLPPVSSATWGEGLRVGRDADRPEAAVAVGALDSAGIGAESHGVDRGCRHPLPSARPRAAGSHRGVRTVGEEQERRLVSRCSSRGGELLVEVRDAEIDRARNRVAESGAVVGPRAALRPRSCLVVVGGWRHHDVGLVGERDDADAGSRRGGPSTKELAASRAAVIRSGATSVAVIEPELSIARNTVASSRGTATATCGRAMPTTRCAEGEQREHRQGCGVASGVKSATTFSSRSRLVKRTT